MPETTASRFGGPGPGWRRAKRLTWRAALGASYAAGAGIVTLAVKWATTSLL
ncbi:hypothetical protein ACGFR8_07905 [Streptomyces brevispora]|uniref:hypothetical protein n=1 Tax=Streptomyces brevispora TaxID=887462 RepID=UPI003719327B